MPNGARGLVHIDYHVEVAGHYYSELVKQRLDVHLSAQTVELFHRGQREELKQHLGGAVLPAPSVGWIEEAREAIWRGCTTRIAGRVTVKP